MESIAVVLEAPMQIGLRPVTFASAPGEADVIVDVAWSGISTGTERLLYTGQMPPFPGMGYPLVPGYESVGRVIEAGATSGRTVGEMVFVPGAKGYTDARALFGGSSKRLVTAGARTVSLPDSIGERGTLMALAATAYHAGWGGGPGGPDLVVGHGALGRLLARIAVAKGEAPPMVWETNPIRQDGARGYEVLHPDADPRRDYKRIVDVSGALGLLDTLIGRLGMGGEVVLAGFYSTPLQFDFPPAFLRSINIRVAAEWTPAALAATAELVCSGTLDLDGLVTHRAPAREAEGAYSTAFGDPQCVKMILDWSDVS